MLEIIKGNDIKLEITLNSESAFDMANIRSFKCMLVRQVEDHHHCHHCCRSTEYTMNTCGCEHYHVHPHNCVYTHNCEHMHECEPCNKYQAHYPGFGINLKKHIDDYNNVFVMPSQFSVRQNGIDAFFPAECQKFLGKYDFVIEITLYDSGWGLNNTRKYRIESYNIFELVNKTNAQLGAVIPLDITIPRKTTEDSVYYGFSTAASHTSLKLKDLSNDSVNNILLKEQFTNTINDAYFWVVSPIQLDIKDCVSTSVVTEVKDGEMYYYRSHSTLIPCTFDLKITIKY